MFAALVLVVGAVSVAGAQTAPTTTPAGLNIERTPMPFGTIVMIALVAAAASAVNGLVGAIFLFVIWMWLYGGVIPSIGVYLREPANHSWAPHLLLPLIVFLLVWQYRLRGRIGPSWGLRHVIRQVMARRSGTRFA